MKKHSKKIIIVLSIIVSIFLLWLFWPASTKFNGFITVDEKTVEFKNADVTMDNKTITIKTKDNIIKVKKTEKIILYLFKY